MSIKSISDVVEGHLCTGCGACAYMEPARFRMVDSLEHGKRPFVFDNAPAETGEALKVCPGAALAHPESLADEPGIIRELLADWGPVYGVWEGYAADPDIRHAGSSGGAATAFSLYCLEKEAMAGVLHTGARADVPYLNETVISRSRAELLARSGSRYSPASPAEALAQIESADAKCVFIGKPCDVAAVYNARRLHPELDAKLGLTIAFFCAGVPSTKGTLDLLERVGVVDSDKLSGLRFRGNGWPGLWTALYTDSSGEAQTQQLTYAESWGFLQRYRQWRCYICPDHTGEFADIAVGDPWYRKVESGEAGRSLIVARSKRGLEVIKAAAAAGFIVLEREDASLLPRSQPNLLITRGGLWGRLVILRLLGVAVPRFGGFNLFPLWLKGLSVKQKIRSFSGTAKRVFTKRLRHRERPVESAR